MGRTCPKVRLIRELTNAAGMHKLHYSSSPVSQAAIHESNLPRTHAAFSSWLIRRVLSRICTPISSVGDERLQLLRTRPSDGPMLTRKPKA